jgi:hypothetical protein
MTMTSRCTAIKNSSASSKSTYETKSEAKRMKANTKNAFAFSYARSVFVFFLHCVTAIQPRHVEPQALDNTVDRIVQFRAYLHYHIKCNKSLLHTRMRKRVESLLQVLNRAIPDIPKEKIVGTGRQFIVHAGGSAGL